ncbi:ABC transporter ATP-binding protein [Buchananella felis]|uniref:ABC transporter ATP-binding protein n=1 Tax=Buchananella felis TaxID=3231492 RepID=UPI0035291B56
MTVQVRNLSAQYVQGRPVLHGLDLEIASGQVTTVLGASGSGKTTLLRVLAGLHTPFAGEVLMDGADITGVPVDKRRVGLVPQEGALFSHLTVAANIAYGLRGVSRRRAASHPRVLEMVRLMGLEGLEGRLPHQLSGGQQQRVALARALAPQPRLLLLDEPFSALDPSLRSRLREEVFAILRQQNLPTLLITHDQEEALSCSDTVAVLCDGHLVQVGTPRELYCAPADAWVAAFVGEANVLPAGQLADVPPASATPAAAREEAGQSCAGRSGAGLAETGASRPAPGDDANPPLVVARPEQLELTVLAPSGAAGASGPERESAGRQESPAAGAAQAAAACGATDAAAAFGLAGRAGLAGATGHVVSTRFLGHSQLVTVELEPRRQAGAAAQRAGAAQQQPASGARATVTVRRAGEARALPAGTRVAVTTRGELHYLK